jgi:hypothetical protein
MSLAELGPARVALCRRRAVGRLALALAIASAQTALSGAFQPLDGPSANDLKNRVVIYLSSQA